MGIRRFNYTGRKRIKREDAIIRLLVDGDPPSFDARLSLSHYDLPADSHVYIEAYRQTQVRRYRFGRVSLPRPEEPTYLAGLPDPGTLLFRVKIVDAYHNVGRLLAEADRIPLMDADGGKQTSLLRVREQDLGGELWRLDFPDDVPLLLLEKRYGPHHLLLSSPHFRWLVLPEILRQLLDRALAVDWDDEEEEGTSWEAQIVRHAVALAGSEPPEDEQDEDGRANWVVSAVKAFCRQHGFAHRYAGQLFDGAGG